MSDALSKKWLLSWHRYLLERIGKKRLEELLLCAYFRPFGGREIGEHLIKLKK